MLRTVDAKLDAKGLVGLAYYELGFRQISNGKRPINKVEDLAGLKLRVIPNPINVDWVKALGANPTPMAFPEVYAGPRNEKRFERALRNAGLLQRGEQVDGDAARMAGDGYFILRSKPAAPWPPAQEAC